MGWDDIESWTDKAIHGVESAGSKVTGALADAASWIGDSGDGSALNWLSRNLADAAGDEIPEKQLGETKDPKELVHGDATAIGKAVDELRKMQTSTDEAGTALKKIDTADWTGSAADSFHTEFGKHPGLWSTASDAMKKAADALDAWGHEVTAAQKKAGMAIDMWDQADRDKKTKTDWWNSQVAAYKHDHPLSSIDSWSQTYQDARDMLNGARADRDNAANTAVTALHAAMNEAPEVPSFGDRMLDDLSDASDIYQDFQTDFSAGLLSSAGGLIQFVRQIDPTDPYNLTHPAQYVTGLTDLYAGMVVAGSDPGAVVSSMFNGALDDPGHALGNLTGQVVIGLATGGGTAAETVTAEVADTTAELSTNAARVAADDAANAGEQAALNAAHDAPAMAPKTDVPGVPSDTGVGPGADTHPASTAPGTEAQPPGAEAPSPTGTGPGDVHPSSADAAAPSEAPAQPETSGHPGATDPGTAAHPESPRPDAPAPNTEDPASSAPHRPGELPTQADASTPGADTHTPNAENPAPGATHPDSTTPATEPGAPSDAAPPHDGTPHPEQPATGEPEPGEPNAPHEPSNPETQHADDQGANSSAQDNSHTNDRTNDETATCNDPVDIATGEFVLPETDVELPGVLPLRLGRRHRSSYRFGRWFGPSWSCTLDMRIVVEHEGVTFLGEDGIMLAYPHAAVGEAVVPVTGNKHVTATRTETGGYRIHDSHRELVWHFAPEPGLNSLDSRLGNYAVSAITDRHRNRIRFHYNGNGEPVEVTHSGGYRVLVEAADGRITRLAVVDRGTPVVVREFAYTAGELTGVTNGVGALTRFTYDEHHRMTSWTDSNSNQMVNTYNAAGQVVRQRGTGGILDADYDYLRFGDDTGSLTVVTNADGGIEHYGFDGDLRLRDHVDAVGARTHTDYNFERLPLRVTAPDGAVTTYAYTGDGDVTRITRPDGADLRVEYSSKGRPRAVVDADGSTNRQEWSKDGNLVGVVDTNGARTEFTYHASGAVATTTDALGAVSTTDTDPAGLPVTYTDSLGATTHIERDGFGRPVAVTDALGHTTRYDWSPAGKLLCRHDPDGHHETWTYDGEGNQLTHRNRAGGITRFTYGAFDLARSRTEPDGSSTHYLWDRRCRLTAVINPLGQRWTYEHDAAGQLIAETDYTGATTKYTYDRAGRVSTVTPATEITRHHTYDILGRLVDITADSGDYRRYTHDALGRILTATSGSADGPIHTITNTWTLDGRLATQQLDDQPPLRNTYDQLGRRIGRTLPSGASNSWMYNSVGIATHLNAEGRHISFTYDPLGRNTGWRVGEVETRKTLDPLGRVTDQVVTGFPEQLLSFDDTPRPQPRTLRHDRYDYRPDGYPTTHTVHHADSQPVQCHYSLDPIGRVTAIHRNGTLTEAYKYDALNNITRTLPEPVGSGAGEEDNDGRFEYHKNLLVRAGRTRYFYDAAGRLIRKVTTRLSRKPAVWHYKYDAFDQLTDIWTSHCEWWQYTYDCLGRRRTKRLLRPDGATLATIDFTWDGTQLAAQTGTRTTHWVYQPDTFIPIAQIEHASDDYQFDTTITDIAGSPVDLIDARTSQLTSSASSSLWGKTEWCGAADIYFRFQGQFFDAESGLHYNLHRTYDPKTGRYLTQDPLGLAPAANPSTYPHNPTSWIDPLGLACKEFNTNGRNLSDPNPVPARIRDQYEEIRAGNGTPRIDPATGQQTVFQGRELPPRQQAQWSGSLEWDVPGTNHRILERPDRLLGYVYKHDYSAPFLFPGPWYPEGGTIPKRLGG